MILITKNLKFFNLTEIDKVSLIPMNVEFLINCDFLEVLIQKYREV